MNSRFLATAVVALVALAATPSQATIVAFTGASNNIGNPPAPDAACNPLLKVQFGPANTSGTSDFGDFTFEVTELFEADVAVAAWVGVVALQAGDLEGTGIAARQGEKKQDAKCAPLPCRRLLFLIHHASTTPVPTATPAPMKSPTDHVC